MKKKRDRYSKVNEKMLKALAECGEVSKDATHIMNEYPPNRSRRIKDLVDNGYIEKHTVRVAKWYEYNHTKPIKKKGGTQEYKIVRERNKQFRPKIVYRLGDIDKNMPFLKKYLTDEEIEKARLTREKATHSANRKDHKRIMKQSEIYMFLMEMECDLGFIESDVRHVWAKEIKRRERRYAGIQRATALATLLTDSEAIPIYNYEDKDYVKEFHDTELDYSRASKKYIGSEQESNKRIVLIDDVTQIRPLARKEWEKDMNKVKCLFGFINEDMYDVTYVIPISQQGSKLLTLALAPEYKKYIAEYIEDEYKKNGIELKKATQADYRYAEDNKINLVYNYLLGDFKIFKKLNASIKEDMLSVSVNNSKKIILCYDFVADTLREAYPECEIKEYNLEHIFSDCLTM